MLGLTRLFKPRSLRDEFQGVKTLRVNGRKFKIRRVNPLLDFTSENVPQIFSAHQNKRPVDPNRKMTHLELTKAIADMKRIVEKGVVEPRLCKELLTVDDIFRFGDTGPKLYTEILNHSLYQFSGIKGVFFSIVTRLSLSMYWRRSMAELRST